MKPTDLKGFTEAGRDTLARILIEEESMSNEAEEVAAERIRLLSLGREMTENERVQFDELTVRLRVLVPHVSESTWRKIIEVRRETEALMAPDCATCGGWGTLLRDGKRVQCECAKEER